jgi:DDE superfamily endonuclease
MVENVSLFCHDLFSSFARSDQRRWGEVYVRGLVSLPGRKTIRRISDHVVGGRADQSLQQFVNQSPWRWEPVRERLAHRVATALRPRALIVEDTVFAKNGTGSVGVARQYAAPARRMLSCQLGLAVLLATDDGCVPVNWRLRLPRAWDDDDTRRSRTRVPDTERHRPRRAHVLNMIDEMTAGWDLPPMPVLIDARDERDVEMLMRGLDARDLRYAVRVADDTPAPAPARRMGQLIMNVRETAGDRTEHVRFVLAPVDRAGTTNGTHPARRRRVLAEWAAGRPRPAAVHLTNLTHDQLPDLVRLVRSRRRSAEDLDRLQDEFGLGDFEGRSFAGWHHHVTLVSVAHAYRAMNAGTGAADGTDQAIA